MKELNAHTAPQAWFDEMEIRPRPEAVKWMLVRSEEAVIRHIQAEIGEPPVVLIRAHREHEPFSSAMQSVLRKSICGAAKPPIETRMLVIWESAVSAGLQRNWPLAAAEASRLGLLAANQVSLNETITECCQQERDLYAT